MSDEPSESVLLYRAKDQIEGTLLEAMLNESGVRAWTIGGQAAIGFGELGADVLLIDVRVEKANHARAMELVEAYFKDSSGGSGAEMPGPWTCAECGELVGATFSSCWKCSTPQPQPSN